MVGVSSVGNDRLASNMVMTRTSKIGREAVRLNTPPPPKKKTKKHALCGGSKGGLLCVRIRVAKKKFVLSGGEKKNNNVFRQCIELHSKTSQ